MLFSFYLMDSSIPKMLILKREKLTRKQDNKRHVQNTMHLVPKGKEIQNIASCNVLVDVVPDWPRGKRWCFKSQHYQD